MPVFKLKRAEVLAILAGLRLLEVKLADDGEQIPDYITDIRTNAGEFVALYRDGISEVEDMVRRWAEGTTRWLKC